MNGAHDLGGQHGFGCINPEPEMREPIFRHDWERRAFAITLACDFLGQWNKDEVRFARESQNPMIYLRNSYYENWLAGLETLLVEKGMVTPEELELGRSEKPANGYAVPDVKRVKEILAFGGPTRLKGSREPKFKHGDQVQVCNNHPLGHTRVPRYTRGCTGTVSRLHGIRVFPDDNVKGNRYGQHLYNIQFKPDELWGKNSEVQNIVYVDLWESYLEGT